MQAIPGVRADCVPGAQKPRSNMRTSEGWKSRTPSRGQTPPLLHGENLALPLNLGADAADIAVARADRGGTRYFRILQTRALGYPHL